MKFSLKSLLIYIMVTITSTSAFADHLIFKSNLSLNINKYNFRAAIRPYFKISTMTEATAPKIDNPNSNNKPLHIEILKNDILGLRRRSESNKYNKNPILVFQYNEINQQSPLSAISLILNWNAKQNSTIKSSSSKRSNNSLTTCYNCFSALYLGCSLNL